MRKSLTMPYRGTRDYLHGTDIFNALSATGDEVNAVTGTFIQRLALRRFARHACDLCTELPNSQDDVVGTVRFKSLSDESCTDGWIIETNKPVVDRHDFNEDEVLLKSHLDAQVRSICLAARSQYTPIEDVVVLTKQLNYAALPDVDGKWYFGQIDLQEPLPNDYNVITIRIKKSIANQFSVSEILIDERRIGNIRFIVGAA